ncbi:MAG TPA: HNH endonuclease [Ktedonobacterales bacterium]|nr:HNH endonuclease [Ktedonobacterales bacterium]
MNILPPHAQDGNPLDPDTTHEARIPLTKGLEALVDEGVLPLISAYRWQASLSKSGRFYAQTHLPKTWIPERGWDWPIVRMHRFVYELVHGPIPPGKQIDHINGDTLDNRLANLRMVSNRENAHNKQRHRTGKLPGTTFDTRKKCWRATLQIDGKSRSLGGFDTEQEAHQAYLDAIAALETGQPIVSHTRPKEVRGCYWSAREQKWIAEIRIGRCRRHLGTFLTEEEAHQAYLRAKE